MNWSNATEIIKSPRTYMAFVIGLGLLFGYHYQQTGELPLLSDENVFLSTTLVLFGLSLAAMLWQLVSTICKKIWAILNRVVLGWKGRLKKNVEEVKSENKYAYALLIYANDKSPHSFPIPTNANFVQAVKKLTEWNYVHILSFCDSINWDTHFYLSDKGAAAVYDHVCNQEDRKEIEQCVQYIKRLKKER